MSLDEAFILLGLEGGAKDDDEAVRVAYDELVIPIFNCVDVRLLFSPRGKRSIRKPSK
jgi:hypothetical protein